MVEGIADKICIEKFAELLRYDLINYYIMPCDGSSILNLAYLCIKEEIKFKALLDRDNKDKPTSWKNKQCEYKERLNEIEKNPNCVFILENGKRKSLEECFSDADSKNYFSERNYNGKPEMKIDSKKIKETKDFSKKTLDNFEQLFICLCLIKKENIL